MAEGDIQQTARFAREFVVMSLVPWMEKCVLEWNENVSTNSVPNVNFSIFPLVLVHSEVAITAVFFNPSTFWLPVTITESNAYKLYGSGSASFIDTCHSC